MPLQGPTMDCRIPDIAPSRAADTAATQASAPPKPNCQQLLDSIGDGVYFVDRDRRIQLWNAGAEEITGWKRGEVEGRRCSDNLLMHVDDAGKPLCLDGCPLHATMTDGQPRQAEVLLRHRAGHRSPVAVRVTALRDDGGEIVGALETFTDSSVRHAMAQELDLLRKQAMFDTLTEIPNRRYLDRVLDSWVHERTRYGSSFAVLLLDIDHFKQVNDTHGHQVGDQVLTAVAQSLLRSARLSDEVGRWGGEEFLWLVRGADLAGALTVAERGRALVASCSVDIEDDSRLAVTASVGVALAVVGDTPAQVLERADRALYQAKRAGRNCVRVGG